MIMSGLKKVLVVSLWALGVSLAATTPCRAMDRWVGAGWAVREPEPGDASSRAAVPRCGRARLTPGGWLRLDELVASI